MAEVIITVDDLRYITRTLEAKRTDKVKVSIVGNLLKFEDLKTGDRAILDCISGLYTIEKGPEKPPMTKRR